MQDLLPPVEAIVPVDMIVKLESQHGSLSPRSWLVHLQNLREVSCEDSTWMELAEDRVQ
jgi:hypothetical protein